MSSIIFTNINDIKYGYNTQRSLSGLYFICRLDQLACFKTKFGGHLATTNGIAFVKELFCSSIYFVWSKYDTNMSTVHSTLTLELQVLILRSTQRIVFDITTSIHISQTLHESKDWCLRRRVVLIVTRAADVVSYRIVTIWYISQTMQTNFILYPFKLPLISGM